MAKKTHKVWKIGTDGEYLRIVASGLTEDGAKARAEREADEAWRSGQRFIVMANTGRAIQRTDVPASDVGMDGITYTGGAVAEYEV